MSTPPDASTRVACTGATLQATQLDGVWEVLVFLPTPDMIGCPGGCGRQYAAKQSDGKFGQQSVTRHLLGNHGATKVHWRYACRHCNLHFPQTRMALRLANAHVKRCRPADGLVEPENLLPSDTQPIPSTLSPTSSRSGAPFCAESSSFTGRQLKVPSVT
ncbi:unnamed protein product [Soboliphyme baturini]|uniref:C2H2-type domain-containing protein n=1 Tax=Soboliphyme baturini TaxID=241478 RepID=A0A183IA50_9BILA|nr:unnamed protein product [Soboliphyme baturini]